jgi:hypothetical protein
MYVELRLNRGGTRAYMCMGYDYSSYYFQTVIHLYKFLLKVFLVQGANIGFPSISGDVKLSLNEVWWWELQIILMKQTKLQ